MTFIAKTKFGYFLPIIQKHSWTNSMIVLNVQKDAQIQKTKLHQEFWNHHCAAIVLERNWCSFPVEEYCHLCLFTSAFCNKVTWTYQSLPTFARARNIVSFKLIFATLAQTGQTEKLNFGRKFGGQCLTMCWNSRILLKMGPLDKSDKFNRVADFTASVCQNIFHQTTKPKGML